MIIGENTQIEGSLEIWTSASISSAGVGSFQSIEVSPTGLKFPNDAFGGTGDTAGIRLVNRGTEEQSLEIYTSNDVNGDWVNLVVPSVNDAKVNGNTIWNAGNFDPASKSDVGHIHDDRYYTETETNSLLSGKLDRVPTIITNLNANSYNDNGVFAGYDVANAPNTLWGILRVWNSPTDSGDQVWQEWRTASYGDQSVWKRGSYDYGATWTAWHRELDSNIDSALLTNSHTHSNKSTLDIINQSLATSASPIFAGVTTSAIALYPNAAQIYNGADIPPNWIGQTMADNDGWKIYGEGTNNTGRLVLEVTDDASEGLVFKQRMSYAPYTTNVYQIWHEGNLNPSNYSLTGHIHDDRYYTESETNSLLSNKSDVSHTHTSILVNGSAPASSAAPSSWLSSGLYINTVYGQDFPSNYGNVLSMDATGSTQIFQGWAGVNAGSDGMWFRNKRDSFDGWSPWQRVVDTVSDATSISNWNTAYTSAHFHTNKSNLDSINQNLSTASQVIFSDITTTAATYSRYGYFGNHTGWVDSTYALRVYGDSLFNGNASFYSGKQISVTKDVDPSVGDDPWTTTPILINRASTNASDFSNVAGLGFHNQGVNAATLYYDPATSQFKYRRNGGGTTQTFWDSGNFNPNNYSLTGHIHDDRYYTESEINTFLAAKLDRVPTVSVGTNANSFNTNGVWMGYNIVNATTTGWVVIRVYRAQDDAGDVIWQEELDQNNLTTFRRKSVDYGATWSSWTRYLDTINDATSISNWNTAYGNTHTHNQTLNTTSNVTFNTITTSEYKFPSTASKISMHGDNANLNLDVDNSSGGVGLLPAGTNTSTNAILGRWDYRWKGVYGGLGNFDTIEEGGVGLSSKYLRLIGDTMTGAIQFGSVGNNAGAPAINFNSGIPTTGYKWMIGDTSNGIGLTIFTNGATRSEDGGPNATTIRNERGPLNLGVSSFTTNIIGNNVQSNGNAIWHAGNFDPNTKQNAISKTVFEASYGNGSATAGWCKLGTYSGNSQSRFVFTITGKAGWNDQNFASQAIIHGGSNYIASDVGQLAAGCKWNEFAGSSETASQIRLVRQSGYNPYTFDIYVLNDNNYVNWTIDVTHPSCSWTTGIAWQQTDPGTGTNVFQATKRTVWETSNFDPSNYSLTSHNHNVKDLSWSTNQADGILNNPTNGITDSPDGNDGIFSGWAYHFKMHHSANPNDWQFLLAADFYADGIGFRRKASGSWQAPRYLWHDGHFSSTNISNWNTAYTNNHTHLNKDNLDTINQNLGTGNSVSFSTIHLTSNGNANNIRIGDDVLLGDINLANTVNIRGVDNGNYGYIRFGTDTASLGYNQTSLNYGGRFDVTQLRAGTSTFCITASNTTSDIWNDQGGAYALHLTNGREFTFYLGTPGTGSRIAGINSDGTLNSQSLTASRVVVSDTSKNLISSNITTTELGHLAGTSANIQTQINQLASASVSGVGAGTINRVSKFTTGTGIGDSNINDDGSTISFLTHITGSTAAFTGGLNVGADGIRFPDNAFGGGGDFAWIRLISKGGEAQSMELYVGNDIDDWVNLVGPDNNFAKVNGNTIWNAGNLTQTSINNWNTAYTSAHFHNNRTYLDSINQNLGTTSNATFGDVTTTGSVFSRYGYFGTHSGWINGTYALRVYGESLLLGNTTLDTNYQLFVQKDITPTTATNTNYSSAPIVINRATQDSSTTTVAGIGFRNAGVNAATLYYDTVTSVFKYNRNISGPLVTIWDDSNFTPGNYLPKSGSFGGSDGYEFVVESGADTGGLSLRLTDNSDGTEYFVVRNNAGDPSLIANSDRTVNIGYQNYQQVKPILSIGDQQYGIGANSGYLDLYSAGGGFRAFSKSGSSDAVFVGNFWHSGNFNPSSKSDVGHTHSILNITDRSSEYVDDNYDVGTAKYLRWKNYGDSHVIIDASQGTAPTGALINNTNPDIAWSAPFPTLMGWNGNTTYGVRVDRSRYSDNADYFGGQPASYYSTTAHNHDDRYYTEAETNLLLSDKSNVGHTHDDRYYTESESDSRFLGIDAISNVISGSGYTNRIPVFNSEKTLTSYSSLYYIVGGSYNDNVLNILHNENTHGGSLINIASGLYSGDSAVKFECSTGSARLSTDYSNKNFYLRTDCGGDTSYPLNIHLHTSGAVTVNRLLAIASSTMVVPTNTGGNLQFSNNGGNTSFNYYAGSSVTNYGHRFHVNDGGGAYSLMMSVDKYALNVYGNIVVSGGSAYGMVSYYSSTTIGNDVTLAVIENTGSSITLTLPAPSNGKKLYVISMDSIGSPNPHRISPPTGCSLRIVNSSDTNSTIIPSSPLIITGRGLHLIAVSSTEWIRIQ